jgi:hypothetical protein
LSNFVSQPAEPVVYLFFIIRSCIAIERKERLTPPREIQFGGEFEAHHIALACSVAPDGRSRGTVRLLAEEMIATVGKQQSTGNLKQTMLESN